MMGQVLRSRAYLTFSFWPSQFHFSNPQVTGAGDQRKNPLSALYGKRNGTERSRPSPCERLSPRSKALRYH